MGKSQEDLAGSKLKMSSVIDTMNVRQAEHLAGEFLAASKDEGVKTGLEICTVIEVLKIDTLKRKNSKSKIRTIGGQ